MVKRERVGALVWILQAVKQLEGHLEELRRNLVADMQETKMPKADNVQRKDPQERMVEIERGLDRIWRRIMQLSDSVDNRQLDHKGLLGRVEALEQRIDAERGWCLTETEQRRDLQDHLNGALLNITGRLTRIEAHLFPPGQIHKFRDGIIRD